MSRLDIDNYVTWMFLVRDNHIVNEKPQKSKKLCLCIIKEFNETKLEAQKLLL